MAIPGSLLNAVRPVTLVTGHYGVGKTNFSCNLAIDLKDAGYEVTIIDLDIVNPYFRASEQRKLFERHGVSLIAPVFAEAGSSLDVPSLRAAIGPALAAADGERRVVVDVGGDDAGSIALGRFARVIREGDYSMLCVLNRFRNLVQQPEDALENMREIEAASGLQINGLVNNSHLKDDTAPADIQAGHDYALEVARLAGLPLVATAVCETLADSFVKDDGVYPIKMYVKSPWE